MSISTPPVNDLIVATAREDGTGTVTLPVSGEHTVSCNNYHDARDALLELIFAEAANVAHPLTVEAHDPDGTTHTVIVHPNGEIDQEQPQAGIAATTTDPKPATAKKRLTKKQRAIVVSLAIAFGFIVIGGLSVALSKPAPVVEPPVAADAQQPAPEPAPVNDQSVDYLGTRLPVDTQAGPARWTPTRSFGFAQTELGAALAAVHISTHIDPYTGPDTFVPTINEQIVGDTAALTARYQAFYDQEATPAQKKNSEPLQATTGQFVGWNIPNFDATGTTDVQILVRAEGNDYAFVVPVSWHEGDWKAKPDIDAQGAHFQSTTADTDTFQPFNTQPTK